MNGRLGVRQVGTMLAVVAVFVLVSFLAHSYSGTLATAVGSGGVSGMVAFVLLTMCFEIFFIPLDLVLLVPLGVVLYGPVATALMSITGWTIGASISFALARRYGTPLVSMIAGKRAVEQLRRRVPRTNLFWSVIVLRMLVPVDLLSYALGLFAPIPSWQYVLATAIGVSPFGFYFAFVGTLSPLYQLVALAAASVFVVVVCLRYGKARKYGENGSVV